MKRKGDPWHFGDIWRAASKYPTSYILGRSLDSQNLTGRMGIPVGIAPSLLAYFHSWGPRNPAGSPGMFIGSPHPHLQIQKWIQKGSQSGSKVDPKWIQKGTKMGPLSGPKGDQKGTPFWTKKGSHFGPLLDQKGVPFWSPFGPKRAPLLVPFWARKGSHLGSPFGPKGDRKWARNKYLPGSGRSPGRRLSLVNAVKF